MLASLVRAADVEVVLPGLRASRMKSADVVKIVLYLLGGIATAVYGFAYGTSSRWLLTATLLGLLAVRAYQTWATVSNATRTSRGGTWRETSLDKHAPCHISW